jgi:hypothetical protein
VKNLRLYIGLGFVGVTIIYEVGLLLQIPMLIFISLLALMTVLVYGIIKELRYRPGELTHIIDDYMRPFEYVHGAFLIVGFSFFMFLATQTFLSINFLMVPITTAEIIGWIILIQSFIIPISLVGVIINKARASSRALVVALSKDSMKLNAAIKSQFIHDKTLIDSLERSINQDYIRPEYTPKLHRLLNNDDVHVRRKAIILLRKITEDDRFKSVSIVPNLLNFLKEDDIWTVRLEAAESLTHMMKILPQIEIKNVFQFLSDLKSDKNRYVRWGIIKLLNSIALAREEEIDRIVPFLLNALEDDEWSVRKGTVESFNQLIQSFPDIATTLFGRSLILLSDEDPDIIKELFLLIQKMTGTEVISDNLELLESRITEKIGPEYSFDSNLLEQAIERIAEATKKPKFVFKKSQLPK